MSLFPKNYVTLNDLRERYMKEKEREKAEAEAKAAAEAENAVVVPVTVEEPTPEETNVGEKAKTEELRSIGNEKGEVRDSVRWNERWSRFRISGSEKIESSKRREKEADVFGGRNERNDWKSRETDNVFGRRNERDDWSKRETDNVFGGRYERSDKVFGGRNERVDWNRRETEEFSGTNNGDGWRNRRPDKSGTEIIGNGKTGESRRNWLNKKNDETLVAEMEVEEKVLEAKRDRNVGFGNQRPIVTEDIETGEVIGNRKSGESQRNLLNKKNDETLAVEENVLELKSEKNVGFGNRDEKKKKKKKKKKKGKGKGKGEKKTEEDEKLLVAMGCVDEEKETVVVNGRVWVKKVTWVLVNESAEIKQGFNRENRDGDGDGDDRVMGLSVVVEKGGNVEGDGNVVNGRRIGKGLKSGRGDSTGEIGKENVGTGNRNGGNGRTGNRKRGKQGCRVLDTSLVWVRKEEKAEVCVAGNCREGVMAKAGEREKRPGRGRP